jgi:N-hydroxyarylamine O-acetyltransferase
VTLSQADLEAYFDRVGWSGGRDMNRGTVAALAAAHAAAIPFENLDPLLGRAVELSPDALVAKLVRGGRGGYCYEQNGLFWNVLLTLGFEVSGLAARVLWMQPEDAVRPRTHMALLVHLPEGPVLADVGFGGAVLTGVLAFEPGVAQQTPHGAFRLIERDEEWWQQAEIGGEWLTTYRFDLAPQLPVDYETVNWWTSTHPSSHITSSLTAARALPGRRLALRNYDFAVHVPGGPTERRRLDSPGAVCDVLEHEFGIRLPDRDALTRRLEALA